MSNVNLILSELSKKKEESITLPFSNKQLKISKPKFKFQEDIVQLFEKYDSEQAVILSYRKFINDYATSILGGDVNILDKNYFLFTIANKLSNENKFNDVLAEIPKIDVLSEFVNKEDDITFKFILDAPSISVDTSFLKFFNNKKNLKVVEYAFCNIFRFVKTIIINDDENMTFNVEGTPIDSIYKVYTSLPVSTCSKLISYINTNIVGKILEKQKDNDIEQDPSIFVDI